MVLTVVACSGHCYTLPLPPTAAPQWPPDASPRPAISYPAQSGATGDFSDGSTGWFFTPMMDVEVTALGYYDDGRDGLVQDHRSAIFDSATRQAVVETTIRPRSRLDGLFRWEPVGPVVLRVGHEYVMVSLATKPFDPLVSNPKDVILGPELRYLRYGQTRQGDPAWGYPDSSAGNVLLSGNFKYKPVGTTGPLEP